MSDYVCFLITVYYKHAQSTLDCALKVKRDKLPEGCDEYPLEPENKAALYALLPAHVQEGPIIDAQTIFEIHESN